MDNELGSCISMAAKSYFPPPAFASFELTIDNLATPPLESPISFHQLQAYPGTTHQPDRHQIFPAPMPTPTDYYPVQHQDPRSSQSMHHAFQTYTPSNSQIIYHHSS